MNKITHGLTIAAVVLLLAGCAGAPEVKSLVGDQEPAETSAPVELTPDAKPAEPEATNDDAKYIEEVRMRLMGMDSTPDADLIAAGHQACNLYEQGETRATIDIIKGDHPDEPTPGWNDGVLAYWGAFVYCPQFNEG